MREVKLKVGDMVVKTDLVTGYEAVEAVIEVENNTVTFYEAEKERLVTFRTTPFIEISPNNLIPKFSGDIIHYYLMRSK